MIEHAEREHSPVGASGFYRWSKCPGQPALAEGLPNKSSVFAEEGTRAHEFAEYCLNTGVTDTFSRDAKEHVHWTEDIAEAVQLYLDTIAGEKDKGDDVGVEVRFHLSAIHHLAFGTADCVIYKPKSRTLVVLDYKHGKGVPVEAEGSGQLRYYALGAMLNKDNLPIDRIKMVIVQPRCYHPDGPVRTWEIPFEDLLEFSSELKNAIEATEKPDAPLVAGDHCQFCPAAAICPALHDHSVEAAKLDFAEQDPSAMSDAELGELLAKVDHIQNWIKQVREYAYGQAMNGNPPTGYKLVSKRPTRKWVDEKGAQLFMFKRGFESSDIYKMDLKSPAQLEKLLEKDDREFLDTFIVKESSGYTLAHESDRRPAVTPNAADDFSKLGD